MTGHNFSNINGTVIKSEIQYHVLGITGKHYNVTKIIQSGVHMFFIIEDGLFSGNDANYASTSARNCFPSENLNTSPSEHDQLEPSDLLTANICPPQNPKISDPVVCVNIQALPHAEEPQPKMDHRIVAVRAVSEDKGDQVEQGSVVFSSLLNETAQNNEEEKGGNTELPYGQDEENEFSGPLVENKLVPATRKEVMDIKPLFEVCR